MSAALDYLSSAQAVLDRIRSTQMPNLERAAGICTDTIAGGGLVYLFGTGHSRIPIEEMFPRHGSFPGFYPLVELSLTFHNQVVGANGQRQAMLLEHYEGLGKAIMRNFVFAPPDSMMIFSNSGVNEVVVEVALEAKRLGLPVMAVVSGDHSGKVQPKHSSGRKLSEVADVTIDNGSLAGDAVLEIPGLAYPVGPTSTIGFAAVVNALKCQVAEGLTRRGQPPLVLTSSVLVGAKASGEIFEKTYDDFRTRALRAYGGVAK